MTGTSICNAVENIPQKDEGRFIANQHKVILTDHLSILKWTVPARMTRSRSTEHEGSGQNWYNHMIWSLQSPNLNPTLHSELDSTLHYHHQNTNWGNFFKTNGVLSSCTVPEIYWIFAKVYWRCSWISFHLFTHLYIYTNRAAILA